MLSFLYLSVLPVSFLTNSLFVLVFRLPSVICHHLTICRMRLRLKWEKKRQLKHNTAKKKMEKDSSNGRHKTSDSLTNEIELTGENVEMHHSERCEERTGKSEECKPGDSNSSVGCQEVALFIPWSLKHAFKKANETKSAFQNPFDLLQNKLL